MARSEKPVVRVPALRHIYTFLRKVGGEKKFDAALAERMRVHSEIIDEMFRASVTIMRDYNNEKLGFHDGGFTPELSPKEDFAKDLVQALLKDRITYEGFDVAPAKFFCREINPLRIRGAVLDTGVNARKTGRGGIDVLGCARDSCVPVIGEVKARTDRDGVFALFQALMYASELATESQYRRLKKAYPDSLGGLASSPIQMDIWLIVEESDRSQRLEDVKAIAKSLMRLEGGEIRTIVRNIDLYHARPMGGSPAGFILKRIFTASSTASIFRR